MHWLLLIIVIPYIYILLRICLSLMKIMPFHQGRSPDLYVSVLVACRNEEKNISALLRNISEQDYNPDLFETIIIDDNSSDNTYSNLCSYNGLRNLRVLKNEGTGKKQAIRTGIMACTGNLIITTDADCRMGKGWLTSIASFCSENNPDMVICPVMAEGPAGFFGRFQELEFLSLQGLTAGTASANRPVMCNGANLAFTRESFIRNIDNLHYELPSGVDVFLLHGIKKDPGSRIFWLESEDARVITAAPETISSFLKQRARWISKAGAYKDTFTIALAIVTFVTILLQLSLLAAGFFDPVFWLVYAGVLILKSIPDYLILLNTAVRYRKRNLLRLFIPSAVIYPFYVLVVWFYSLFLRKKW